MPSVATLVTCENVIPPARQAVSMNVLAIILRTRTRDVREKDVGASRRALAPTTYNEVIATRYVLGWAKDPTNLLRVDFGVDDDFDVHAYGFATGRARRGEACSC